MFLFESLSQFVDTPEEEGVAVQIEQIIVGIAVVQVFYSFDLRAEEELLP